MAHAQAVKEIVRSSGVQFDPKVVQEFLEVAAELHDTRHGQRL